MSMNDSYFFTVAMCVGYHGNPLIKDIGITLRKGEILTLIGPNGAGKSTILKSIAGQLELIGGTAWLDQHELEQMRREELAKKMSVLFTEKIRAELFRGGAAATRRNLSRTNLELRQDDPTGETSFPKGEIVTIVITNTPFIGGDSSRSTSSSAPSHLQTLVHHL